MGKIRSATPADAARIAQIYLPYVRESVISFEAEPPSASEIERRMLEIQARHPWLVYELEGRVVGYAYASAFKGRAAYDWSVESTVYVDSACCGKGIGKGLYRKLLAVLQEQGIVNVIGVISLPNEASVKLHEGFGFLPAARFKNVGFKFGQWWDVGYWQLELPRPAVPGELKRPRVG